MTNDIWCSALEHATNDSGTQAHSRCQGPVARSNCHVANALHISNKIFLTSDIPFECLLTSASIASWAVDAWPLSNLAHAKTASQEIGLRFCAASKVTGIVRQYGLDKEH